MKKYVGIDIGGTKCAVSRGYGLVVEDKIRFETTTCEETLAKIVSATEALLTDEVVAVGISCGSPLDSQKGIIQSPPNLPDWKDVPIVDRIVKRFGLPAALRNDADASALAEWRFGAGKGSKNMVFCTFGTGFGAGIIADGKLYTGASDGAGEIGHVTLYEGAEENHIGYYKRGSVEGYCSGGGIEQYGKGSAKELAEKAARGDEEALMLWKKVGEDLGKTLAMIVDVVNPEIIVLGGIYPRARELFEADMRRVLDERTLPNNRLPLKILPSALSENVGDVAALTVATLCAPKPLYKAYPELSPLAEGIEEVIFVVANAFRSGNKLMTVGNGGSAADADHIVGELMKGFKKKRPVADARLPQDLASKLQGALPAICLSGGLSLPTAFSNDCDGEYAIAQALYGLGKEGDVLILISTSGNAKNLIHAAQLARCIGVKTILLSGRSGGKLQELCDLSLLVPADETYRVQEYHLPIYHEICAEVEKELF